MNAAKCKAVGRAWIQRRGRAGWQAVISARVITRGKMAGKLVVVTAMGRRAVVPVQAFRQAS
jgi:hypothetical protein